MDKEAFITLREKIQSIPVALLITQDYHGNFRSRPMLATALESSGLLWFFTNEHSAKVREINHNSTVNIGFSDPATDSYVSVSGQASVVKDKAKVKKLWTPGLSMWFKSPNDPTITLLRVSISKAEYWEPVSRQMLPLLDRTKSTSTHTPAANSSRAHEGKED
jgi:general stress protein 26